MAKDLIDDIIQDIKNYSSNVAKFAAIEVRDELAQVAHDAIESFYNDYEPEEYYRNYYNFKKKSYSKYYHDSHGTTFSGGIEFTPEEMDELYIHDTRSPFAKHATYGAPAELVFEKVMEGWHGLSTPYNIAEQMNPTPMEMINKAYDRLCRSNTLLSHAEKKARDLSKYL